MSGSQNSHLGAGLVLLGPAICCGAYALTLAGGSAALWGAVQAWGWGVGSVLGLVMVAIWALRRRLRRGG